MTRDLHLKDILKLRREVLGLSQIDLARKIGLNGSSYVTMVENGKREPSVAYIEESAKVLGVDLVELWENWRKLQLAAQAFGLPVVDADEKYRAATARVLELQQAWVISHSRGKAE